MTLPSKRALRDELASQVAADLDALERAQAVTREGATHEEAKPENDKDTRALEQSYLARGQAMRVEELRTGLAEVSAMPLRALDADAPIGLGALVAIELDDEPRLIFVAAYGGGTALAGGTVQVVTPRSPLGSALLGKRADDDAEVDVGGRRRALVVLRVE